MFRKYLYKAKIAGAWIVAIASILFGLTQNATNIHYAKQILSMQSRIDSLNRVIIAVNSEKSKFEAYLSELERWVSAAEVAINTQTSTPETKIVYLTQPQQQAPAQPQTNYDADYIPEDAPVYEVKTSTITEKIKEVFPLTTAFINKLTLNE